MTDLVIEQLVEINKKVGAPGKVMNQGNLELIVGLVKNARTEVDKATELLYEIIILLLLSTEINEPDSSRWTRF